jgi:hypothetical protein
VDAVIGGKVEHAVNNEERVTHQGTPIARKRYLDRGNCATERFGLSYA